MEFHHISVLLNECIENLDIKPDGIYVDGTMGGGGHSLEIAKRLTTGRLIGIDQDPNAHEAAGKRLEPVKDRVTFVRDNFGNIANILDRLGIEKIDGMLMDIGVSSHQLDEAERKILERIGDSMPYYERRIAECLYGKAKAYMEEIWAKGKTPILVGGTGFYINALLYDNEFTETDGDTSFREECYALAQEQGAEVLYEKLKAMP